MSCKLKLMIAMLYIDGVIVLYDKDKTLIGFYNMNNGENATILNDVSRKNRLLKYEVLSINPKYHKKLNISDTDYIINDNCIEMILNVNVCPILEAGGTLTFYLKEGEDIV